MRQIFTIILITSIFITTSPALANGCNTDFRLPLLSSQLKDICTVVQQSDVCKKVSLEDRMSCSTIEQNADKDLWEFLKGCTQGVFNSAKSFLSFMWEIMKWVWENNTSSKVRGETLEQITEYSSIAKLYLHTEFERAYFKETPPFQDIKALKSMGGAISALVLNLISNMISEKYQEFSCMNYEAKSKMVCQLVGDIFIPPAAAIALIEYGSKAFKIFPKLEQAFQKLGTKFTRALRATRAPNFKRWLKNHSNNVWSPEISTEVKKAIGTFQNKGLLASGKIYGESVRTIHIEGQTAQELEKNLLAKSFTKHHDVIHDPFTHRPILDPSGNAIVMDVYTHPDGGMVRVKPMGEPGSKFRPQPHAVKAVRYPADAPYDKFEYEVFKVDDNGNALPKWSKDFNNPYGNETRDGNELLDGLADDTHVDLAS